MLHIQVNTDSNYRRPSRNWQTL